MAEVDFSDLRAAEAWLQTQSVEMRCVMASRAALRVAANLALSDADLINRLVLTSLRAILTSAGRGHGKLLDGDKLETVAADASRSAALSATADYSAAYFAARSASDAADAASYYAARSADSAAASAARTANSADAYYAMRKATDSAARSATAADAKLQPDRLLHTPVWGEIDVPGAILQNHAKFLTFLDGNPDWAFWRKWYARMWDGTFRDWDLAIEVALIPADMWEGEEALAKVAEAIRGIEARRLVASTIADHNASVERVAKDDFIPDRGHNNPPELIEDTDLANRSVIVWSAIDALQSETESETPDKHAVGKALSTIAGWIADVLIYVGRKLDLSVDQVIKWGVPLGGTYLVTHPAKLQAIVEAGQAWLPFLP